eukprot:6692276-Prymnesium_polylepis.1
MKISREDWQLDMSEQSSQNFRYPRRPEEALAAPSNASDDPWLNYMENAYGKLKKVNGTVLAAPKLSCETYHRRYPDFALYSYTFGDYRQETKKAIAKLSAIGQFNLNAFYFTDANITAHVHGWIVVRMQPMPASNGIPGARLLNKFVKFKGHSILAPYRYLIHMDSSTITLSHIVPTLLWHGLLDYVRCNPQFSFFGRSHPGSRKNILDEFRRLQNSTLQPTAPLTAWLAFLRSAPGGLARVNSVRLPALNFGVRDTHDVEFVEKWASIYDLLHDAGLWRDQLVYSYVMQNTTRKIRLCVEWGEGYHACPSGQTNGDGSRATSGKCVGAYSHAVSV